MSAWEYVVLTLEVWTESTEHGRRLADREAVLAELGRDGWELVTVVPLELDAAEEEFGTTHERWIFKRPVNADGQRTANAHATIEPERPVTDDPGDAARLTSLKRIVPRGPSDEGSNA